MTISFYHPNRIKMVAPSIQTRSYGGIESVYRKRHMPTLVLLGRAVSTVCVIYRLVKKRYFLKFGVFRLIELTKLIYTILYFILYKWYMEEGVLQVVEKAGEAIALLALVVYSAIKVLKLRRLRSSLYEGGSTESLDNVAQRSRPAPP